MADFMKALNKVEDSVNNVISLANSKKEFIAKQLVNGFLLFIILLVFGCLDFATLQFHFEYLIDLNYWVTVGTKTIAGVCAFNIGINLLWETELKRDEILDKQIKEYGRLITYKKVDFEYYINNVLNPEEKKKAYLSQINKKIYLLNKFSRAKDRLLYSSELPERQEEKKKNLYCKRRKELEDLKNNDFINKNLDSLKVHYSMVDASVFELEIDGSPTYHGLKVKGNVGGARAKATSSMILGMVAFSMFCTAIGLEINGQEFEDNMVAFWHYLLKCCEDIGIVLWQCIRGMSQVRKMICNEYTTPYANRNRILKSYINWRMTTQQPTQPVDEELAKEQEVEILEITEEELESLK